MIRRRPSSLRSPAGFTLLEMMLALAVFAIVLAAINGVYFGALRLRNKTSASIEAALPVQQTVATIKRDLTGIMLPGGTFGGPFQTAPTNAVSSQTGSTGVRTCPDIFSSTGAIDENSPFSEVQKVAYFLVAPTNNAAGRDLIRSVTRNLLPASNDQPDTRLLMAGVDQLSMQFYNGTSWIETWDSTTSTNLPLAIKVQIVLTTEANDRTRIAPVEFIVPVMVQPRTNTTAAAAGGGA